MFIEDKDEHRHLVGLDTDAHREGMTEEELKQVRRLDRISGSFVRLARELHGSSREAVLEVLAKLRKERLVAIEHPSVKPIPDEWWRASLREHGLDHMLPLVDERPPVAKPEYELKYEADIDLLKYLMDLHLCESELEQIPEHADRAVELLEFLTSSPSDLARAYLARVSLCYLRGMSTEGVIMCRAVLEAAIKKRHDELGVTEADIRENVPRCGKDVTLIHHLMYAKNTSKLLPTDDRDQRGQSSYDTAIEVKENGDNAVHTAPGLSDLKETLAMLVRVLDHIYEDVRENAVDSHGSAEK
jgi:hypothetical protein